MPNGHDWETIDEQHKEIQELHADRDRLKAENFKLKEELAEKRLCWAENARLREALSAIAWNLNDATMDNSHIKMAKTLASSALRAEGKK